MTKEDYWHGDSYLAYCYRKADDIRFERQNSMMHLMGAYNYNALMSTANGYAWGQNGGKGRRPDGYTKEKFAITDNEKKLKTDRDREHAKRFFEKGQ